MSDWLLQEKYDVMKGMGYVYIVDKDKDCCHEDKLIQTIKYINK